MSAHIHPYVNEALPDPALTAQLLVKSILTAEAGAGLAAGRIPDQEFRCGFDSLINSLYMITEDGLWAQKKKPSDWVRRKMVSSE